MSAARDRGVADAVSTVVHRLASTKHRHAICNRHHLVELVRDEDHRLAVGSHRAQCLEELLRLLRREHRGRLVHDQNPGLAVERLKDLDSLLLATDSCQIRAVGSTPSP